VSTVDPNQETADLVVVGAGAAGLATAIFAKEAGPDLHIVLLEGAKRVGAKILISGGGRCNVTHRVIHESDFQGNQPIVRGLLRSFTETDTVEWFASMGVELKEEDTGKLFPTTDSARTVLDALLKRCADLGIELLTSHRVQAVRPSETGWTIEHTEGSHTTRRVAIATGGLALPKSGSDGFGLDLARDLGHEVTPTWPGLVPLLLEDSFPHARLSGIAHEVELTTWIEGKLADRRAGALLWTHFGISGPVAMDASRFLVGANQKGKQAHITASLLPDPLDSLHYGLQPQFPARIPGRNQQRRPDRSRLDLGDAQHELPGHDCQIEVRRQRHPLAKGPLPAAQPRLLIECTRRRHAFVEHARPLRQSHALLRGHHHRYTIVIVQSHDDLTQVRIRQLVFQAPHQPALVGNHENPVRASGTVKDLICQRLLLSGDLAGLHKRLECHAVDGAIELGRHALTHLCRERALIQQLARMAPRDQPRQLAQVGLLHAGTRLAAGPPGRERRAPIARPATARMATPRP